jgi:precorrin-6B C5,15-methyltransferase / cobalt-precorrin-6B C5,C15-methyltransferase
MSKWLTIIGIGDDGYDGLSTLARGAISDARIIIGSRRTLSFLPPKDASLQEWPQPFSAVVDQLKTYRNTPTVMLATGDPMNFGAARKILEFVSIEEVTIIPHISSFSMAAARLGWSLPDCDCFTIHGRPAANLEGYIQPSARLIVLTQDGISIAECARRLCARGFENSIMHVLENLGGPDERVTQFIANAIPQGEWSPLNTLAIQCVASPAAIIWSRVAGLADEAFEHDGQLTKREVRAATIAALAPAPDQLLWDVGAGCGSVAIEWIRSTRGCEAVAIEIYPDRIEKIARNSEALGAPRLKVIQGEAPLAYEGLRIPDAIFIGGGIGDAGVFDGAWAALKSGGNLVANCVTLEGEARLFDLQARFGGDLVRIDVSSLTHVGALRALRPRMSVLQWRVRKP